jgi:hypothetical protein
MKQENATVADRAAGAETIAARAVALAKEKGVDITQCVWDMGEDLTHEYAHRLDLFTETNTARIYFSDLELTALQNDARRMRTEDRLNNAIDKLVTRTPSPTYAFR